MILQDERQRTELLRRFYAREPDLDGRFLVGVRSTGIYCLPSCPARKPKPENVVLIEAETDALGLGLRPCKRCRPELFGRGIDLEQELARELARDVRARPGDFADVGALARHAGYGKTKLVALVRREFHQSPGQLLLDARLARATRALRTTSRRILDVAHSAGFEGASAFHANFRARAGLTPRAYRALGEADAFTLALPADFRREDLLALFGRDPNGCSERVEGRAAVKALRLAGRPARLELAFERARVRCRVAGPGRVTRAMRFAGHAALVRLLGLAQDPGGFERRAARAGHAALVREQRGTRIPCIPDPFEALVWVIVGQQVNLAFAALCRARLIGLAGADAGAGMRAHPGPEQIAALEPQELLPLQFSRRKAEYLVDAARAIVAGALDLEALALEPAGAIAARLGAVRGLGPWSVRYLMMRAFGLADCVPVGDSALVAALVRYFALDERPDARQQEALLAPFAPQRSLATFHLWKQLAGFARTDPHEPPAGSGSNGAVHEASARSPS